MFTLAQYYLGENFFVIEGKFLYSTPDMSNSPVAERPAMSFSAARVLFTISLWFCANFMSLLPPYKADSYLRK